MADKVPDNHVKILVASLYASSVLQKCLVRQGKEGERWWELYKESFDQCSDRI
jgi:hypothetical protein